MKIYTICFFLLMSGRAVLPQAVDLTLTIGATGADVVQAVVDKIKNNCIYADDRLFLRRLAYVESRDGHDPKTFRTGYFGGIWQVDKDKYDAVRNCHSNYHLVHLCDMIQQSFGITWENTTWQDLTKPLYSGLAASLYIYLRAANSTPGELVKQAEFWTHYYHFGESSADFLSTVRGLTDAPCSQYNPMDIVFVVDSSASIGLINFIGMLEFLQNITDKLAVGPDSAHIGMVSFETTAQVEFLLNRYYTRAAVKNAIGMVYYLNGGTDIASGIYAARRYVFNETYGARKDAVKIMILLTDGQSYLNGTMKEAKEADKQGIETYVIGIGGVSLDEINAAATDPDCTHVFLLSSFNEMESLLYQIQKSACRSSIKIQIPSKVPHGTVNPSQIVPTDNTTKEPDPKIHIVINANSTNSTQTQIIQIGPSTNGSTSTTGILTNVTCGIVQIYASYVTPHPGPAIHEIHSTATDEHPSVLYVNSSRNGKPLYIAYVGTKLPETAAGIKKCENASYTVTFTDGRPKGPDIICRDGDNERECTKTDLLLNPAFSQWICSTDQIHSSISNPCTTNAIKNHELYHPYPKDNTKFIRCDYQGKMYVNLCPEGEKYHQGMQSCGSVGQTLDINKVPLDSGITNPCTQNAVLNGKLFFEHPKDKRAFIHCDVWGHAWVIQCPAGEIWTQGAHTCTLDSLNEAGSQGTGHSTPVKNPCSKENIEKNYMFFPLPDRTKFIHCDISGNSWVQSCGVNQIFDATTSICVYDQNPIVG